VNRFYRTLLIASTVVASWLGMQAIHELGHVIGAWLTGGEVDKVVLHPLAISRTDLLHNPHPLFVVWAGPVLGVLLPVLGWTVAVTLRLRGSFVLRFFAGFCLIANGAYIGAGSFEGIGDAGQMLRHGSTPWLLCAFGLSTSPCGLWLWHNQGRNFGLGREESKVDPLVACLTLTAALSLIGLGLLIGH
jgi:hypothetical protein